MVVDFKDLKAALGKVLNELDHTYLNDIEYFKTVNPTSENIAKYIFDKVSEENQNLNLKSVTVWETGSSSATYSQD